MQYIGFFGPQELHEGKEQLYVREKMKSAPGVLDFRECDSVVRQRIAERRVGSACHGHYISLPAGALRQVEHIFLRAAELRLGDNVQYLQHGFLELVLMLFPS